MNFCIKSVNKYSYREPVEWSNFWYDNANDGEIERILIIGDSTARMVRSTLAKQSHMPVDLFATSSPIDDILFVTQVNAFFCGAFRRYSTIFLQVGHHGRMGKEGGQYSDTDYAKFRLDLIALITFLQQFTDNIVLETIFDSVKKKRWLKYILCKYGFAKEEFDDVINNVTRHKNEIIVSVAQSGNMRVSLLDINEVIKKYNFIRTDHIHFEAKAKGVIVQEMLRYI